MLIDQFKVLAVFYIVFINGNCIPVDIGRHIEKPVVKSEEQRSDPVFEICRAVRRSDSVSCS